MSMSIQDQFNSYKLIARTLRQLAGSYAELIAEDPMIKDLQCDLAFDFSEDLLLHRNALASAKPPFHPQSLLSGLDGLIELILSISRDGDHSAMHHAAFDTHPRWISIRSRAIAVRRSFAIDETLTLEAFEAGAR